MSLAQWILVVLAAACAAGAVMAVIRLRASPWIALLLACLPVAAILCKDDLRIFSWHGFQHTGIVYRILAGDIPPTNPFFAGEPSHYPWGHHAVIAALVRVLDASPPTVYALTNVAMLAAMLILLYRAAALAGLDRVERLLGVVVAVYGVSAFSRGPLWLGLEAATHVTIVTRILPVEKFTQIGSNAAGVLCFALFLASALRIVAGREGGRSAAWLGLFAATLGAAFLYPISWFPLVASCSVYGFLLLVTDPKGSWRTTAAFAAVLVSATLVAVPYLLEMQSGNSETGFRGFTRARDLVDKTVTVASFLALVGAVGSIYRGELVRLARQAPRQVLLLAVSTATCLALYTALHLMAYAEYKFLLTATLPLGLLAGPPLAALYRRMPAAAFGVVWLALIPAAHHGAELLLARFGPTERIRADGALMRQTDPARAALDDWIRRETPADAVFVDSELSIPTFAQRTVFALLDAGQIPLRGGDTLHGWGTPTSYMLYTGFGLPKDAIVRRYDITMRLLSRRYALPRAADLADLRRLAGTEHIYLIVRDSAAQRTPDPSLPFDPVYRADRAQVYRLRPEPETAEGPRSGTGGLEPQAHPPGRLAR
jgi:hypothetical protein